MTELAKLTIKQALDGVGKREFTSKEVVKECAKAIAEKDAKLHAFLRSVDGGIIDNTNITQEPLLCGLPLALKDNILTKDFITTASSNVLREYKPQ